MAKFGIRHVDLFAVGMMYVGLYGVGGGDTQDGCTKECFGFVRFISRDATDVK